MKYYTHNYMSTSYAWILEKTVYDNQKVQVADERDV